jgi:hypothetical protein
MNMPVSISFEECSTWADDFRGAVLRARFSISTGATAGQAITIRCSVPQREAWERAAEADGALLSEWVRVSLDAAARVREPAAFVPSLRRTGVLR